jgi:hypothetical protein
MQVSQKSINGMAGQCTNGGSLSAAGRSSATVLSASALQQLHAALLSGLQLASYF